MSLILNPYKVGSRGAMRLKAALQAKGLPTFTLQRPPKNMNNLIVNWGNSEFNYDPASCPHLVNDPKLAGLLTNKLRFFRHVGHSPCLPEWWDNPEEARASNRRVFARQVLEGSGGAGIVCFNPKEDTDFPAAKLYVAYENKTHEYRVHMARSFYGADFSPILVQRKIFQKKHETDAPADWLVRNHANGFVFVVNSGEPTPPSVVSVATEFMKTHFAGLHFCALDIIYNAKSGKTFILEGNTAPGMEGNTINVYAGYLQSLNEEKLRGGRQGHLR